MGQPATSALDIWSTLTAAISGTDRLESIYSVAVETLAAALHAPRASVLLFDEDGVMRFKAWRGLSDRYRRAVEGHSPWAPGSRDAEPIAVADVAVDPSLAALLPTLQAEGIGALAFIPLSSRGLVIGKFMIYYDVPHAFSAEERQLATAVAAQVAFAVERTQAHDRRIEASEEAARAMQRLAAIVEYSDDAIVSKDLQGRITSWNAAAERMFGYTAAEALGQPIAIIVPSSRRAEEAEILAAVSGGRPVQVETVRERKDGTCLDISLTVSPVRDRSGRVVGASKIARNITARKQAETEIADLHRGLTTLVNASASLLDSPATGAVTDAAVTIARELLVADAYAIWRMSTPTGSWRPVRTHGLSAAYGRRVIDSQGGSAPTAATLFTEPLAAPDVTKVPLLAEHQDAYRHEGITSMLACPMRFGDGTAGTLVFYYRSTRHFRNVEMQTAQALANLAAAAMTTADLYEEQRRQRDAAEFAHRQARFLADVASIFSRSLDYEQALTAVAERAVPELADWCAVDLVGADGGLKHLAVAHIDPAKIELAQRLQLEYPARDEAPGGVAHVIRTGQPAMMETIPPAALAASAQDDEHRRILEALALTSYMCLPLVSPSRTRGAITFVFAESGRHYTPADLRFAQELAARAGLALENADAYRRAHEANRLKDEFLATLSHELRTPLNAVLGYGQMLGMGHLDEARRARAVDTLSRNAEALKQIIDDVLDVSRITAGKLRLHVGPVELSGVVQSAIATVQPAADARGVTLETALDPNAPTVSGDPDRLQQVIWNLLSNAVKFTPRGGRVQISLRPVDAHLELTVRDTGQGIAPEFLPHVFERFRQADSRFAREHGGLGLGLAIARDLVEMHGGHIRAASAGPGEGATFRVMLPAVGVTLSDSARDTMGAPEPLSMRRLAGLRVLAVDDDDDALGLLREILESAGAEVTVAGSGAQALDLLPLVCPAVLVADLGMPHMDGLELIRRIRELLPDHLRQVPAVALTAYARSEDRVAALASGFQIHLPKPVNAAELVVAVAELSGRSLA